MFKIGFCCFDVDFVEFGCIGWIDVFDFIDGIRYFLCIFVVLVVEFWGN